MESLPQLKVGQAGVARFGAHRRHTMRETGLFDLLALYDYVPEHLAQAAAEEGATPCGSYEELLDFPGLEGVVISTGAKYHAEQVLAAAERGLHVFVEKPLCSTPAELHALLACRERTGVVIGVGHADHSASAVSRTIKRLIDAGELGTVVAVEETTAHNGGMLMKPDEWRADPAKNPGGMLFQCGIHDLAWVEPMFGPVAEVASFMRYDVNHGTETSDATVTILRLRNGIVCTLNAYHVTAYHHYKFIYGTKGNLYIYEFPTEVYFQERSPQGKPEHKVRIEEKDFPAGKDHSTTNVRTWAVAIRGMGDPCPSIYDGASAVATIFAAEESTRTGRIVAVPDYRARVKA